MVTVGTAIVVSFPVVPLEGWNRSRIARSGTGMIAFHVNLPPPETAEIEPYPPWARAP